MSSISVQLARPSVSLPKGAPLRVRWSRVVTLLAVLAIGVVVGAWVVVRVGGPATAGTPRGDGAVVEAAPALVEHTVAPGDTLWGIATAVDPSADPRPMVDRIMRLNNLESGEVALGAVLLVPARP